MYVKDKNLSKKKTLVENTMLWIWVLGSGMNKRWQRSNRDSNEAIVESKQTERQNIQG